MFCIVLILVASGYILATPYLVEVINVYHSIDQRIPEYFKLTVAIEIRNYALLDVTVEGALVLHCTLMSGLKKDIIYPVERRVVKPHSSETLEATIFFTFTTPEKPEAIYTYSVDAVIVVRGVLTSRIIEVKSIYYVGGE
ncbi:MAG: hypothetical protein QXD69_04710 [Candidatus Bathyarchaeia archaeon]